MFFFFFNDTATTEIYTLSLHDALPISLTEGVPASVTSATSLPLPSRWRTRRSAAAGECAWTLSRSAREPTCASRVFVWRGSSAATAATPRRGSAARGERASRVPSGVATTQRRPDLSPPPLPGQPRVGAG